MRYRVSLFAVIGFTALISSAATYEVGPGKQFSRIGQAPWATLQPGDTVLIYWSSQPYREKFAVCRSGSSGAPITVRGVAGPEGQLPVVDGQGAVAPSHLAYWNENRGVVKIGGCSKPADTMPAYIDIENLDVRGARGSSNFTATDGSLRWYDDNAGAIYIEKGRFIAVRNCTVRDSANGIFVSSGGEALSSDILIEGNYIHDNGNVGSGGEHNVYAQARGITYQYNRFGPLAPGSGGENLKDRSSGTVVRSNWIEGGNRQLDLVDATSDPVIRGDGAYRSTYVYGNILVEPMGNDNRTIVHYGGDSGDTSVYRKGTLYFYNNTIVSTRTDRTTIFRPATNDEHVDARNNIFYASAGGNMLSVAERNGRIDLTHNCAQPGWTRSYGSFEGSVNDDGSTVSCSGGVFAGAGDYRLASGSACVGKAGPLASGTPPLTSQYVVHQRSQGRGSAADIGAFGSSASGSGMAPAPGDTGATTPTISSGQGSALVRINAGGPAVADPATGTTWQADTGYSQSLVYSNYAPVTNTSVPALYQTERYSPGGFSYVFPVPNGARTVKLRFAEIWFSGPGKRVFDVAINGQKVISNFDIAAAAGARTAIDRTFTVNVTGGRIRIDFLAVVENPKVSAIEIE